MRSYPGQSAIRRLTDYVDDDLYLPGPDKAQISQLGSKKILQVCKSLGTLGLNVGEPRPFGCHVVEEFFRLKYFDIRIGIDAERFCERWRAENLDLAAEKRFDRRVCFTYVSQSVAEVRKRSFESRIKIT